MRFPSSVGMVNVPVFGPWVFCWGNFCIFEGFFAPTPYSWSGLEDQFYQKSCHFVPNFQRKKYNVPMLKYVHPIIYQGFDVFQLGEFFSKAKDPHFSTAYGAYGGSSSSQIKRPGACGVFSLGSHPGAARGRLRETRSQGRRSKIPRFPRARTKSPLLLRNWKGYQKGWVNWFLGKINFGVQRSYVLVYILTFRFAKS